MNLLRCTLPPLVLAAACAPALAQDDADLAPLPEPPPPPPQVESGEVLEPDVTIIQGERQVVEEYRMNGRLYMVRVVPDNAPPYYLMDLDGDGSLETTRHGLAPGFVAPHWILFRW
jgi:hypothetical protein